MKHTIREEFVARVIESENVTIVRGGLFLRDESIHLDSILLHSDIVLEAALPGTYEEAS